MAKKETTKKDTTKKDLEEIKKLLEQMNKYLAILVDIEETRKRLYPTSEELFRELGAQPE